MMWQLLCNLYISRSKGSSTECEKADNQDALFTWGTANAPPFFFSLSPFLSSSHITRVKSAECIERCIVGAGHVNLSDDSPRRKGYYLLRKNRGALKTNSTAVYLLWSRWNLRDQRMAERKLCDDIYSPNAIILNPTLTLTERRVKLKLKIQDGTRIIYKWQRKEGKSRRRVWKMQGVNC